MREFKDMPIGIPFIIRLRRDIHNDQSDIIITRLDDQHHIENWSNTPEDDYLEYSSEPVLKSASFVVVDWFEEPWERNFDTVVTEYLSQCSGSNCSCPKCLEYDALYKRA